MDALLRSKFLFDNIVAGDDTVTNTIDDKTLAESERNDDDVGDGFTRSNEHAIVGENVIKSPANNNSINITSSSRLDEEKNDYPIFSQQRSLLVESNMQQQQGTQTNNTKSSDDQHCIGSVNSANNDDYDDDNINDIAQLKTARSADKTSPPSSGFDNSRKQQAVLMFDEQPSLAAGSRPSSTFDRDRMNFGGIGLDMGPVLSNSGQDLFFKSPNVAKTNLYLQDRATAGTATAYNNTNMQFKIDKPTPIIPDYENVNNILKNMQQIDPSVLRELDESLLAINEMVNRDEEKDGLKPEPANIIKPANVLNNNQNNNNKNAATARENAVKEDVFDTRKNPANMSSFLNSVIEFISPEASLNEYEKRLMKPLAQFIGWFLNSSMSQWFHLRDATKEILTKVLTFSILLSGADRLINLFKTGSKEDFLTKRGKFYTLLFMLLPVSASVYEDYSAGCNKIESVNKAQQNTVPAAKKRPLKENDCSDGMVDGDDGLPTNKKYRSISAKFDNDLEEIINKSARRHNPHNNNNNNRRYSDEYGGLDGGLDYYDGGDNSNSVRRQPTTHVVTTIGGGGVANRFKLVNTSMKKISTFPDKQSTQYNYRTSADLISGINNNFARQQLPQQYHRNIQQQSVL